MPTTRPSPREHLDFAQYELWSCSSLLVQCAARAKFGGLQVNEAKRLRELEAENAKLKKLLAESQLDIEALKVAFGVKR